MLNGSIYMQLESFRHNHGFTLVELITVMVILGVLAVIGSAKFFNNSTFKDTQYHQEILSAFRFAQKIAIASQCDVSITMTADSYSLTYSGTCSGNDVKHPSGKGSYADTDISEINPVLTFIYNSQGAVTSTGVYSFTVGGHNITVEQVTGYAHES